MSDEKEAEKKLNIEVREMEKLEPTGIGWRGKDAW
jgi:hypothetical protein